MDLATVAASVLRPGASIGLRDERFAVSLRLVGSLLDGRVRLADISPDLARAVRAAAAADGQATLILPAGPGPARIDLGGRQFVLAVALRDALVAALDAGGEAAQVRSGAPVSTSPAPDPARVQLPTQALVAAASEEGAAGTAVANALAASGTMRAARNETTRGAAQAVAFEAPVLDRRDLAGTAERLAARVTGSGVFFEAHVAQWARGDRSTESVQREAQQLSRATLADPARAEARTTVQLDALQRQTIALSGPAWAGQSMLLELGRDPQVLPDGANGAAAAADPVFVARLSLDLPRLGPIEIRLRLAGEAVAATVFAGGVPAATQELAQALPLFGDALAARGLRPVLLQAVDTRDGER